MPTLLNPNGVAWRVNREAAILMGGRRALLMQIAHPLVAAAVAEHSSFRQQPFARLRRTIETMFAIAFGTVEQANDAYRHIDSIHARVRGRLAGAADGFATDAPYNARDPELLFWVHATLIDTATMVYRRFVGSLSVREEEELYEESKAVAHLFKIPDAIIPDTLDDFHEYMESMIEGGPVRVSETGRELARSILYPLPMIPSFAFDAINLFTIGVLPPALRAQFELAWNPAQQFVFDLSSLAIRVTLPMVPDFIRAVPAARAAEHLIDFRQTARAALSARQRPELA
jgi:uncharacterized protein (DUF2236 family)